MPLKIQWSLCYNFIQVYFIKFLNEKVGLKAILISQFQMHLFLTFIIPKFLKFCSWFSINPIEDSIVSKWNLSRIRIFFCVFMKKYFFLNMIFFSTFFAYFTMLSPKVEHFYVHNGVHFTLYFLQAKNIDFSIYKITHIFYKIMQHIIIV